MENKKGDAFWEEFDRIAEATFTWLWKRVLLPVVEIMAVATVIGTVALVVMFALSLYGYVRSDAATQAFHWVGGAR